MMRGVEQSLRILTANPGTADLRRIEIQGGSLHSIVHGSTINGGDHTLFLHLLPGR